MGTVSNAVDVIEARKAAIGDGADVQGEDVKVAGVPVGVIDRPGRDPRQEGRGHPADRQHGLHAVEARTPAARSGAQGLIGEKFVECEPGTSSARASCRGSTTATARARTSCRSSTRARRWTSTSLNDILRLPYRERLAILLNEFGTGLAGRGEDLNEVIHRANPALRETDKVLKILASQNRTLGAAGDATRTRVLAPLAREKEHFADFIVQANATAEATAERARRHPAEHRAAARASCASCGR